MVNHTRRQITVAEAEAICTPKNQKPERIEKFPQLAKPFGFQNPKWENLKAQMLPGDELWECWTSPKTWQKKIGRKWIELTRAGKPICSIVVLMN